MRNPARIKPLLNKIEDLWFKYPDLRLCQLILNITSTSAREGVDIFYLEDNELEKLIKEFENKYENQRPNNINH